MLRKDKINTEYYKKLLDITLEIEKQVYVFLRQRFIWRNYNQMDRKNQKQ
ncbi:hypothetical protein [Borrelia anserina]